MGLVLRGEFVPPDEFVCEWRLGSGPPGRFTLDAEADAGDGRRAAAVHGGCRACSSAARGGCNCWTRSRASSPASAHATSWPTPNWYASRARRPSRIAARSWRPSSSRRGGRARGSTQSGDVLRQEVELPLLGRLALRDELFDETAYDEARNWLPADEGEE